jgi:hypothetical protein
MAGGLQLPNSRDQTAWFGFAANGTARAPKEAFMTRDSLNRIARGLLVATLVLVGRGAHGEVAATGTFGIDVHVSFPFTSGTFDGTITGFNAGPFMAGGTPINLQTDIGTMSIDNGQIPQINASALAATFNFDANDANLTAKNLSFHGAGIAVCTDAITCAQGQGTFVGDVTSITDPDNLLPNLVYTFDGTVVVDPGPTFDASGVFGLNAFTPANVPAGNPVMATSDPTSFFDSRQDTLRNFLVDLTFAGVTNPGTVAFLGKSAIPGSLPANITVDPTLSVFIDIVTGGGLAFTPPVDVCITYEDVDQNGIVDGTSLQVEQLRVLHALALGDNFQDVTTTVGGGKACGQVGTLSPFVLGVGPVPTTTSTSTSTVTTTSAAPTTTTTLPELLPGKKLLLKDKEGKPQKRGLNLLLTGNTLSGGNGSGDDPVQNGGSLSVASSAGGFAGSYNLPASGWKYVGKSGQGKGYKFKGATDVKSVVVKNGKIVAVGKGSNLDISLANDPTPVTVVLDLGDQHYCARFGGTPKFTAGKKYLAKGAPAPSACGSPSGAFLD